MTKLTQDVIDRNAYRYSPEFNGRQTSRAIGILARLATTTELLRPTSSVIQHDRYHLDTRFELDANATLRDDSLSGSVVVRDTRRYRHMNHVSFHRAPLEPLWQVTDARAAHDNVPNEAIISQIRNASPNVAIPNEYLGSLEDAALFNFLCNTLQRTAGKKREFAQRWDMVSPIYYLSNNKDIPVLLQRFQANTVNGSPGLRYTIREPALPMLNGSPLVKQIELFITDIRRKTRKVGAEIIHVATATDIFDEDNLSIARYAHYGSKIDPDDLLTTLEESADEFAAAIFTVDNLV